MKYENMKKVKEIQNKINNNLNDKKKDIIKLYIFKMNE